MATTLADIRKNRSALLKKVEQSLQGQEGGGDRKEDDRFWKPTRDAAGNGSAIIRFLPPMKDDELPWVKVYSRAFKVPATNKWYINEDLSTIGQIDPVYEYIKPMYDSGDEEQKKIAAMMKRKTSYISNVLIIKDPGNPENEGKVKLFKYGKKIYDMIKSKAQPTFEDEVAVYVYDIDEGANFRLRIKTVDGYPNYDSSIFDSPSALCGGDEDEIEKVIDQYIPLSEFLDPSKFKSYEQLKKELDRALGLTGGPVGRAEEEIKKKNTSDEVKIPEKKKEDKKEEKKVAPPWDDEDDEIKTPTKVEEKKTEKASKIVDDDDDDMELFKEMLKR